MDSNKIDADRITTEKLAGHVYISNMCQGVLSMQVILEGEEKNFRGRTRIFQRHVVWGHFRSPEN